MFKTLGGFVTRFPWVVLGFWVIFAAVAAPGAALVGERLSAESEVPAGSESGAVSRVISEEFSGADPEQLVLAIRSGGPRVGEPGFEGAVNRAVDAVRGVPGVGEVTTYREEGARELAKPGGREAAVLVGLESASYSRGQAIVGEIRDALDAVERPRGMEFYVTGNAAVYLDMTEISDRDVVRAESTALPLTLVMLVVAFGALVAALLPVIVGVVSIVVALGALFLVTQAFTVSIFAQSVVTILGLAVGIDYALLMVNRFREELAAGLGPREAAAATAVTAGRTVAFSGGTVALSLAALLAPPVEIVRSIGVSGLFVVLVAVAVAVTAVPAMLALVGERVNSPRFLHRITAWTRGEGFWRRLARTVMRRPALYALVVTALLVALALPVFRAAVYNPGEKGLGKEVESRRGVDVLRDLGLGGSLDTLDVVVDLGESESFYGSPAVGNVDRLARKLEELPGVKAVSGPTSTGEREVPLRLLEGAYATKRVAENGPLKDLAKTTLGGDGRYVLLRVVPEGGLEREEARPLVRRIESAAGAGLPGAASVRVGGSPVETLDYVGAIYDGFPLAVAAVFTATFALLLLAFRSLVVPLLSILMNTLSVGAALGLLVLVFQEGYGGGLLGLPARGLGSVEDLVPVTVFAITFGLSMDYQVFLLSRVQEHRLAGQDVARSVAGALESTGRVISYAALIMLVVFSAFMISDLAAVQSLGFGLAAAVLLDATLVRLVLVPALLYLAGDRGWWLPKWLDRLLPELGLEGEPTRAGKEERIRVR